MYPSSSVGDFLKNTTKLCSVLPQWVPVPARTRLLKAVTLYCGNVQDVAKLPERRGDRISKTSRLPK